MLGGNLEKVDEFSCRSLHSGYLELAYALLSPVPGTSACHGLYLHISRVT